MEKEIVINHFGGPEVLELREKISKEPGDNEVAIQVKACGINFADIVMRIGLYKDAPPKPFVPGYEVAGIIAKVGKKVQEFKVGDRVLSATFFGGYATYVCAEASKTRLLPDELSFAEGAAIPVNYLTAYIALYDMCRIRKGDHVLIHGAAGGVGLAAVQMAKEKECIIYGTAGSARKLDFIREMGVHFPISYREEDFVGAIRRVSNKELPLDAILDPVGGENIKKNLSLLKASGRTVIFGASSMISGEKRNLLKAAITFLAMRKIDTLALLNSNRGVFGLNVLKMWDDESIGPAMNNILAGFKTGNYKVNVSETFPLENAAEAHRYIQDRKNIGKVILTT